MPSHFDGGILHPPLQTIRGVIRGAIVEHENCEVDRQLDELGNPLRKDAINRPALVEGGQDNK